MESSVRLPVDGDKGCNPTTERPPALSVNRCRVMTVIRSGLGIAAKLPGYFEHERPLRRRSLPFSF